MSKVLVAYFSASGVTAKVAKTLSNEIGATLFEIVPEVHYTNADLNWQDSKSRSSIEMNDRNCRPAIRTVVENMNPYDFSGKTVVPFATSGGSDMGDTVKNMNALSPNANVSEGKRFSANVSANEIAIWASAWL